jgi:aspartate racemase
MKRSRCLGLVGGLGVGATVHYYEKLAKASEAQGATPEIVIVHAETARVFEYVGAGDRPGLAEYLAGYIGRLKAAGAEIAALPAVTPHYAIRQLASRSPLPVLSLFDSLTQELSARGIKQAAVFGTRFVMESALFGEIRHVDFVRPKPDELDYVHSTYVEVAATGKGSIEHQRELTRLAQSLVRRDGLDAIILAGTDFSVLFNESNTEFPFVDCAALHIRAILENMVGETRSRSG